MLRLVVAYAVLLIATVIAATVSVTLASGWTDARPVAGVITAGCPFGVPDPAGDIDGDLLTNGDESALGTHPCKPDTDTDGCADGEEVGPIQSLGGQRNPLDFWDFFDVTGDQSIDLSDTLDILGFFGDAALPSTPGDLRDRDSFGSPQPWQTYEAGDGVDLTDALVNLQSFGHDCSGPP